MDIILPDKTPKKTDWTINPTRKIPNQNTYQKKNVLPRPHDGRNHS